MTANNMITNINAGAFEVSLQKWGLRRTSRTSSWRCSNRQFCRQPPRRLSWPASHSAALSTCPALPPFWRSNCRRWRWLLKGWSLKLHWRRSNCFARRRCHRSCHVTRATATTLHCRDVRQATVLLLLPLAASSHLLKSLPQNLLGLLLCQCSSSGSFLCSCFCSCFSFCNLQASATSSSGASLVTTAGGSPSAALLLLPGKKSPVICGGESEWASFHSF